MASFRLRAFELEDGQVLSYLKDSSSHQQGWYLIQYLITYHTFWLQLFLIHFDTNLSCWSFNIAWLRFPLEGRSESPLQRRPFSAFTAEAQSWSRKRSTKLASCVWILVFFAVSVVHTVIVILLFMLVAIFLHCIWFERGKCFFSISNLLCVLECYHVVARYVEICELFHHLDIPKVKDRFLGKYDLWQEWFAQWCRQSENKDDKETVTSTMLTNTYQHKRVSDHRMKINEDYFRRRWQRLFSYFKAKLVVWILWLKFAESCLTSTFNDPSQWTKRYRNIT